MDVVGDEMKSGEKFIPEVLLSARTMQACLDIIKPLLAAGEQQSLGTVVIGTVEGDMHDIGKNLAAMLLSGAGFEVVNLGKGDHSRRLRGRGQRAQAADPRHERTADDDHPEDARDDPGPQGRRPARQGQGHRRRRARERRVGRRRSAPTPTGPTPRSASRSARNWSRSESSIRCSTQQEGGEPRAAPRPLIV